MCSVDELRDDKNLEKYMQAGKIATQTMAYIIKLIKPQASIYEICSQGDKFILDKIDKIYKKPLINGKGIAFPVCISRNNIAGFYRPLRNIINDKKNDTYNNDLIQEGDLVKIELGVHIDGFPAIIGYTVLVNSTNDKSKVTDSRANVLAGVTEASKEILQIMKEKKTNFDAKKLMKKCADKYGCQLLYTDTQNIRSPGNYSYQVSQNIIDEHIDQDDDVHHFILSRETEKYDFVQVKTEFEENEVFVIDIGMSTGSGRLKNSDSPTSIFRRNYEKYLNMKLKCSRKTLNLCTSNFPMYIESIEKNKKHASVLMGIKDCIKNDMIKEYPILCEEPKEYIARVMFTVIVRKNKPLLISGLSEDPEINKTEIKKITDKVQ